MAERGRKRSMPTWLIVIAVVWIAVGAVLIPTGGQNGQGLSLFIGVSIAGASCWVAVIIYRGKKRGEQERLQGITRREQEKAQAIAKQRDAEHQRALELASASARVIEKEKIVERQVLVMRCKYCKKLTPADLSDCERCGARQ